MAIGHNAGGGAAPSNLFGDGCTFVGGNTDLSTNGLTNAGAFGYLASVNASDKIRIGNTGVSVVETQTAFTVISDKRFKFNVKPNVPGLSFITLLNPVTYNFDNGAYLEHIGQLNKLKAEIAKTENPSQKESLTKQLEQMLEDHGIETGFLAQDVEAAAIEANFDFNGVYKPQNETDTYSIDYSKFVVPLVQSVKELNEMLQKQQLLIEQLQKEIDLLKNK